MRSVKTKISIFLTRAAAGSLLAGLSLIACPSGSGAATEPVIVEAEGEAFLGTYDTPKEVMERARQNALNRAVEKAVGYFIRSHAVVSNFRLAEELTFASVRGRARQVEIIKEGWDERERQVYRVALRAAVDPVYPEKGGGVSLKLWMAKDVLRPGEETKIFYQVDADCYVYLFSWRPTARSPSFSLTPRTATTSPGRAWRTPSRPPTAPSSSRPGSSRKPGRCPRWRG